MPTLTVYRRGDIPAGDIYEIQHDVGAVRFDDGRTEELTTGLYVSEDDVREDDEIRRVIEMLTLARAAGLNV